MIQLVRRGLRPVFQRAPRLRSLALDLLDLAARPVLLPFRLGRPDTDAAAARAIEQRTDELNAAAETYYAAHADADHVLGKPFSEPESLARRLIDVGVLIDGLRLRPGHTVLELGAGSCWLSHMLNRFGCLTIAVDVSPTALSLGRTLFARHPDTNWSLAPRFLAYDGHTLPLAAGSVDRAVMYDAYHHAPNPGEILREVRRVLHADGILAMSEPGRGHASSGSSRAEAASTGVLESELTIESIAELAVSCGFAAARVVVASHTPLLEIDALDLRRFMGGRGFARYWRNLCAELDGHHYLLLFAGNPEPTTSQPRRLKAVIGLVSGDRRSVLPRNEQRRMIFDIHNAGDTVWLAGERQPGWTRFGAHLYRADRSRTLVDFDWLRVQLPEDVMPERSVRVDVTIPSIEPPGDYLLVFDLVIEGVAWFADRGSVPLEIGWPATT
jgi:SAM-dependent methyltransferase